MRTSTGVGLEGGGEIPKVDALGRRSWSLYQRQRIVAEALAPHASVAEVARVHGGAKVGHVAAAFCGCVAARS
ncbi:MAG: hypothetical protein CR217_16370 [Beijerinckiaceae bacterium]|nr:MAG: hypothetical protein CR217_16370 [Beijerinckiaceae bacterium]